MRYDNDILSESEQRSPQVTYPVVQVEVGMVLEDRFGGFVGDVVRWNAEAVTLRDRHDQLRHFGWKSGRFLLDGSPVTLTRPPKQQTITQHRSASGALLGERGRAQVAKASRIWVEGVHDADLLELVWGDDLRELGIVVEPLHGADDLARAVDGFRPCASRRLGVLLDHLVVGSKETRLAAAVNSDHVLITGHHFVDVWAAVRPKVVGLPSWPDVPRGVPWKEGLCAALGVPVDGFWTQLRGRVRSYADLEPSLVGAVEQLIDFVAAADDGLGGTERS